MEQKVGEFELNKIYCMDCLEGLKKIPNESIDLISTDPPYGINFKSNYRKEKFDYLENDDNLDFLEPFIKESFRVLKENTHIYIWCRWDVYHKFYEVISKYFKIKNCLIIKRVNTSMGDLEGQFAYFYEMCIFAHKGRRTFNKTNLTMKDGKSHKRFKEDTSTTGFINRYSDLIESMPSGENRYLMVHPTQKAEQINKFFIQLSSNKDEIILDPFIGSGTTAVACKQLNRNFIGFEISQEYVDIANNRLNQEVLNV